MDSVPPPIQSSLSHWWPGKQGDNCQLTIIIQSERGEERREESRGERRGERREESRGEERREERRGEERRGERGEKRAQGMEGRAWQNN